MDENGHEKRIDLTDESGVTRREVLRRGAIVGGTLLWVAPAIQSISQKAFAADAKVSGGECAACYCYTYTNHPLAEDIRVEADKGKEDLKVNLSSADCDTFCTGFDHSSYCTGTSCFTKKFSLDKKHNRFKYDPGETEADGVANLLAKAIGC